MLKISLQFFAHKKGVGSTKNGRDSESKRLGVARSRRQYSCPPARHENSPRHQCRPGL